ncbi:hypothetical protein BCV69DRAFT_299053 [Microstroma glucosiphilum]|uniref:Uncharacterized protein n=1 Tax=Pseudomicrostroma glucosiphilum TaxID=1684307 RepID=A0A316U5U6_9BASI|nr:hypothetical protein BCV69DRAFT_299053 [Pseudomicrostroma glucosiphilum]PWN20570.1 hypothetical protein BCV69DRAFT_299053 [Pseudomicrostroma glucosiphilum]
MASLPPSTAAAASAGHGSVHIQIVHTPGITRVLYAPKSAGVDRLFTGGDDYLVRLLPTSYTSDQEPLLIEDATAPVTWLDAGRSHLLVASEDGSVRVYKHNNDTDDETQLGRAAVPLSGILTRTSLPTRCVALEKAYPSDKSPRAAICSDELIVKIVDVEDNKRVHLLTGHSRAVRAASWSPRAPTLVTSSCDGTARVWDCSTTEPGCTKVLEHLPVSRPEDETDIHAEWHPSGDFFVLPSRSNELVTYSSSGGQGWARSGTFAAPARGTSAINAPTGSLTAISFCPNGRYLAAATTDGQVTIWETASRAPIRARKAESNVTGLSWKPDEDALAWVDTDGQLNRWQDVVGSSYQSPSEAVSFGTTTNVSRSAAAVRSRSHVDDLFAGTGLDDDDDDDQGAGASRFMDDEAGDGRNRRDRSADNEGEDDEEDGLEDFVVDDEAGDYTSARASEHRRRQGGRKLIPRPSGAASIASLTAHTQAPFQPNSTPSRNSRRYLSLSLFGSLVSIDQETHHVVSFESFDSAARRNWKMVDHFGYSFASVAASGALLACPEKGDNASSVHFKPFEAAGAWSTPGAEWSMEMPRGEDVVAIAMGGTPPARRQDDEYAEDEVAKAAAALTSTAIVATSAGYLRFFSSSGLQRYVWAFGSQVVAMAAGKQHAVIVHRPSTALDGSQNLSYTLIDMISFEVKQTGLLPLGKCVELRWVGFNELDVACFYDSRGVMHLLDRAFAAPGQARWTPVLDTASLAAARKDSEDDSSTSRTQFWPLSMSSTQMFCIFVRGQGGQAFPDPSASGHPLIQEVDLKLPLLNLEQPSGELEEKYLRNTLLASSIRSATASLVVRPTEEASDLANPAQLIHEADKDLLQLIQLACKADKHARALDATRELHGSQMLDAALQIAAFFHLPSLADRMSSLREWIETRDERDERLERDGPAGVAIEDFSEAAERSHRSRDRVFAPSSQSPMPGGGSTTAQARRALMQDFGAQKGSTPRRSQGGRGSGFGNSIMDASPAPSSVAMPPPPAVSSTRNMSSSLLSDSSNLMHRDEDEYRSVSPPAAGVKRKTSDYTHEDAAQGLQKQRSTSNPFNKTSLSTPGGAGAARNPFARQPGSMVRDRSMHKSNSFFDRAEADLTEGSVASAGGRGSAAAKKTKQTTLFGSAPPSGDSASATNGRRKESASKGAATPAFGETQSEEDSQMTEGGQEESLRLTLDSAVDREERRERRGGLEETQAMSMEDEDEETQPVDAEEEEEDQPEEKEAVSGRSKLEAFRRRPMAEVA